MDEKIKILFAMFVIGIVTALQVFAWHSGIDGTVFAFTSLVIGAVAGSVLGFSLKKP